MSEAHEKQALHRYLQNLRGVMLWKLDGLSDYDIRRPMTPTGTNSRLNRPSVASAGCCSSVPAS